MTVDHEQQKPIERVRGLLAKASSLEFEAESVAFEEKALALMAETPRSPSGTFGSRRCIRRT